MITETFVQSDVQLIYCLIMSKRACDKREVHAAYLRETQVSEEKYTFTLLMKSGQKLAVFGCCSKKDTIF